MTASELAAYERAHYIQMMCLAAGFAGVSMKDVRAATGLQESAAGDWLRILRSVGAIEPSADFGRRVRWGPPGTWAHYAPWREKGLRNRMKRAERKADQNAHMDEAEKPFLRVVRAATECAPIQKAGPASVWELAA